MKTTHWRPVAVLVAAAMSTAAYADPDKDESGHGRKGDRAREYKEEFWDGNCKVERKWEKNGDYKEERKCEGRERRRGHRHDPAAPAAVAYPPWIVVQQGEPVYRPGYEPAPRSGTSQCQSQRVGQVLGGLIGGVLGNQVGKGSGRAVATVGGAVAGVLIGGEIGRRIDAENQACIAQALEYAPEGQRVEWSVDAQTPQYAVVAGKVEQGNGSYCRRYQAEVMTASGWQRAPGKACRRPDGTWVAVR